MVSWMSDFISRFGEFLLGVLPVSPFRQFINEVSGLPYLGYLNWFLPVSEFLRILTVWLSAVSLFYLYSILMRWVKMIGD